MKNSFNEWLQKVIETLNAQKSEKEPSIYYDPPVYLKSRYGRVYIMVISSDFAVEVSYDDMPGISVTPIGAEIMDEKSSYKEITADQFQNKGREVISRLINLIHY